MSSPLCDNYVQWLGEDPLSSFTSSSEVPLLIRCGRQLDAVYCARTLAERALRLLEVRDAVRGPALCLPQLDQAVVLVSAGTHRVWKSLMSNAGWPPDHDVPTCVGIGEIIWMAHPEPSSSAAVTWLDELLVAAAPPPLTSALALARCLTEAQATLRADAPVLEIRR